MKNKAIIFGLAILALLFISCEEGPSGIFYRVAHEKPLYENQTKGLIGSNPAFVARLGTTNYLGAGQLWSKADGSNTWTVSGNLPADVQGKSYFAISGLTVDGKLYVLFKDTNALDLGVFSFDGDTWSIRLDSGLPAGQSAQKLLNANGELFLATTNNNACSLFYLNSGAFVTAGIQDNASIGLPNSVAWDGAAYWFTAGKALLKGSTTGTIAVDSSPSTAILGGIAAQDNTLVLSDKSGKLYASTGGTAWTVTFDSTLSFTEPVFFGTDKLVVGTDAQPRSANDLPRASGYREFSLSATTLTEATASELTDTTNFAASLADQKVSSMALIDMGSSKKILYALTYGDGLWANYFDSSNWSKWLRE